MQVFIYNQLLNPKVQNDLRINWTFISFAFIQGRLYQQYEELDKVTALQADYQRLWGNSVIYGAIYYLHDSNFYIRTLDAYHACSLSTLQVNHKLDYHHRHKVKVTPIYFDSIDDLARLKYREKEPTIASTYFGNSKHSKIYSRLKNTQSYRLIDGIDANNFIELYQQIKGGD